MEEKAIVPSIQGIGGTEEQKKGRREQMRRIFEVLDEEGVWKDRVSTTLVVMSFVLLNTIVDASIGAFPEPASPEEVIKLAVRLLCLSVYTFEMILKMRVYGLRPWIYGVGSFLYKPWCVLELLVVLAGFAGVALDFLNSGGQVARAASTLYILRHKFSKVLYIVTFYSKYNRALTRPTFVSGLQKPAAWCPPCQRSCHRTYYA
jgi:hypothetical protein